jgi:quinol monooxygenase YgiN
MSFVATFRGIAAPDHVDAIKASLVTLQEESRTQSGTLRYEFYQMEDDPTVFMLFAVWQREADWRAHVASPAHDRHVERLPAGAWATPPQMTRWTAWG